MKKNLILLLSILMVIVSGAICAYAEETDGNAITVTIKAEDGLEVPESGVHVTVYAGVRLSGGGSAPSDLWYNSYSYPYSGWAHNVSSDTKWLKKMLPARLVSEDVYIMPDTRSATVTLNSKWYPNFVAYHTQQYSGYIGSGGMTIGRNTEDIEMTVSYVKAVKLSGTVRMPANDKNITYHISMLGDVSEKPEIKYDYTFGNNNTLEAGETTFEYSEYVRPDMDYTVHLSFNDSFYNDVYKIQQKTIHVGQEDETLDFDCEKANTVTGTISLPEGWNEFKDINGNDVDEFTCEVYLQDADAPHNLIDSYTFNLSPENRSADFVLSNTSDAENTIVYYEILPEKIKNLCAGAAYKNDNVCTIDRESAAVLKNKNQNIKINMLAGKSLHITLDNQSVLFQDDFVENLRAIMTDGSGAFVLGEGDVEYEYYLTLPADCEDYILNVAGYGDDCGVYYTDNGFSRDMADATLISTSETEKTVVLDRYEQDLPVSYEITEPTGESKFYHIKFTNNSEFDIENMRIYTVRQYEDGEIELERDRPVTYHRGSIFSMDIEPSQSLSKLHIMMWDGNMRPLCDKIELIDKTTEE